MSLLPEVLQRVRSTSCNVGNKILMRDVSKYHYLLYLSIQLSSTHIDPLLHVLQCCVPPVNVIRSNL